MLQSYISRPAEIAWQTGIDKHLIPLKFFDDMMRLKRIPRSGWISYRIGKDDVESVSSHSYSVAVISLTMSETLRLHKQAVNVEKVLRTALLHDLSESLTFDISKAYLKYLGRKGSQLKTRLERRAASHILAGLQSEPLSRMFRTDLEEYAASRSFEAKIVHCADAIDLLLQIIEYEKMGYSKSALDEIWKETKSTLMSQRLPLANGWLRRLEHVRESLAGKNSRARSRYLRVKRS